MSLNLFLLILKFSDLMPFRTPIVDCDKNALPWSEKNTAVLMKAQAESDLKGFREVKDGEQCRIVYFFEGSAKEVQDIFSKKRESLITFYGIKIPPSQNDPTDPDYSKKEQKHKEEYWNNLIANLEKS